MCDIKKLLGKRIKELRLAKGLSQQNLAEKINIDQRSLSCIECGNAFPSRCLLNLANSLNVEVGELFNFSHLNVDHKYMKNYIKDSLSELPDEYIKFLYKLIKSMR